MCGGWDKGMISLGVQGPSPWALPTHPWSPFCQPYTQTPVASLLTCSFSWCFRKHGWGWGGRGWKAVISQGPRQPLRHSWLILTFSFLFSLSLFPAIIKPPDVTCIPKVRSIQMIVHPTYTPIRTGNGHRLTLEDIFQDLFYHLKLHINHTYQMVNEG